MEVPVIGIVAVGASNETWDRNGWVSCSIATGLDDQDSDIAVLGETVSNYQTGSAAAYDDVVERLREIVSRNHLYVAASSKQVKRVRAGSSDV